MVTVNDASVHWHRKRTSNTVHMIYRCNLDMERLFLLILLLLTVTSNVFSTFDDDGGGATGRDGRNAIETADNNGNQWTCDELTPNLCPDLTVTESGQVPIRDGLSVQYWKYERISSNFTSSRYDDESIPLILIHGGPAFTHNYLLPLKQQACRSAGRAVYLYDQAGCGESKLPSNITNVTTDLPILLEKYYYAVEELPKLIEYWGLTRYHILGNSWGTILCQYFALKEPRPPGLVSLTLSGPLSDGDLYQKSQWDPVVGNLGSLPPWVQGRIRDIEYHQSYNTPEYKAITDVLTTFFTVRTAPAPDCWEASEQGANMEIYVGMQGTFFCFVCVCLCQCAVESVFVVCEIQHNFISCCLYRS
jgi:proline-specific peptidase